MNWNFYSRTAAIAVLAAAGVFSEPALAQDASAQCWVNSATGKTFGGPNMDALPSGTTESSPGLRSGDGHQYQQVPCPPPGAQAAPPARNRGGAAPPPEQ